MSIPHEDICIGITASSNYFYSNKDIYEEKQNQIIIKKEFTDIINSYKQQIINNNCLNMIYKLYWAPNKQMGLFKNGWDKIKYYRSPECLKTDMCKTIAPDHLTGKIVQNNKWYFYASIVPRSNDIGLFNELGCTTLYYTQKVNLSTIKYLTTDDFIDNTDNFIIINNIPFDSII